MTQEEFLTPIPITEEDFLYRQVHVSQLEKSSSDRKKRFPKASHFVPDSDGLSTYLERYASVKSVYHIIGLSYKIGTTDYKNYREFKVFAFPVNFLRDIEGVTEVKHTPLYNGGPAPLGYPNNYAHSSVVYGEDDIDVRLKLSNYCNNYHDEVYKPIELNVVDKEIEELRSRLQNTPYHLLQE